MPPKSILEDYTEAKPQAKENSLPLIQQNKKLNQIQDTPDRIIDFLRNLQQAGKYLTEEEKQKLKDEFLQQEKKWVKKAIIQKQNQQEARKKAFTQEIKEYEHQVILKQVDDRKNQVAQRVSKVTAMEQEMKAIKESALPNAEKINLLQQLLKQLDDMGQQ
ncbi:Hypothetical_protein [Hexamita inflata]|uniref:Hypothetical_protein n=1 Tax=Hexamita inflata TaxID=28002 RepID=A0AA86NE87_9EUKA|nr:Hypothetical protein HINF_LOCUS5797 [Hexamita inflata]